MSDTRLRSIALRAPEQRARHLAASACLLAIGALAAHQAWLLRAWVQALPPGHGRQQPEHFLPLALRRALPDVHAALDALATVVSRHPSTDGSERLLLRSEEHTSELQSH